MDDLDKLKEDIKRLVPKTKLEEGRVFNNVGEMLRSMINDVRRVHGDIHDGMSELEDVEEDLNDIIHYYMDAEIKQQRYQ